jgi:hypothetical protein
MAGTPWTDMSQTGDIYFTNEFVDNVLGSYVVRLRPMPGYMPAPTI